MTLGPLVLLLTLCMVFLQFWRLRGISESSIQFAQRYCDKHHLQFIALARTSTKLSTYKGKIDWRITYQLEFSSNGEDAYIGSIVSFGKYIVSVDLPVYKVM